MLRCHLPSPASILGVVQWGVSSDGDNCRDRAGANWLNEDRQTRQIYNIPISSLPGTEPSAASSCFLVLTASNQWTQPRHLEAHLLCCCSQFSPDDILESVGNVVLITVKSI